MKLNPKLTGALAWGGLILILAVPAADMVTRPQANSASIVTSDMEQVRTAAVDTASTAKPPALVNVPTAGDPVDDYVSSGKKLPSYISDAPAEVAATRPAPAVKLVVPPQTAPTAQKPPVEVATLDPSPTVIAPEPYPASRRPLPSTVSTARAPSITTLPSLPAAEQPLIIEDESLVLDEDVVARREAAVSRVLDDDVPASAPRRIDGDRLQEWDSGSLADYLESRGMINDEQTAQAESEFDDDGFFLDEGPRRERRVIRRLPRDDFFLF